MRLGVATALVAVAVLAGSAAAGARTDGSYPASFERTFMASCNATSGGMTTTCRCALRWIERRYTYRKLAWIYLHDKSRMRKIMISAAYACIH